MVAMKRSSVCLLVTRALAALLLVAFPARAAIRGQLDVQGDGSTGTINLSHPFLDNNPAALLLAMPRDFNADTGIDVHYDFNHWRLSSNGPVIPSSARYWVLLFDGDSGFRHVTTAGNTAGHITTLNDARLNGKPGACPIVTRELNASGVPVGFPFGVWYSTLSNRWTIYYEDTTKTMPLDASFSVFVPKANEPCYVHQASAGNINDNYTIFNSVAIDQSAPHRLFAVQSYKGTYNNEWIGVSWLFSHLIGNVDETTMSAGVAFHVFIAPIFANGFEDDGTSLWSDTMP